MASIEDLQADVERIETELWAARKALHDAQCEEAGVRIGDIVRGTRKFAGKRIRVTGVTVWSTTTWVDGNIELKDGKFGKCVRHVYEDWERIP
jgi:hypothetical protein